MWHTGKKESCGGSRFHIHRGANPGLDSVLSLVNEMFDWAKRVYKHAGALKTLSISATVFAATVVPCMGQFQFRDLNSASVELTEKGRRFSYITTGGY